MLSEFQVVAVTGARPVGKTTLARQLSAEAAGEAHGFDLEGPTEAALLDDPSLALRWLTGLAGMAAREGRETRMIGSPVHPAREK